MIDEYEMYFYTSTIIVLVLVLVYDIGYIEALLLVVLNYDFSRGIVIL